MIYSTKLTPEQQDEDNDIRAQVAEACNNFIESAKRAEDNQAFRNAELIFNAIMIKLRDKCQHYNLYRSQIESGELCAKCLSCGKIFLAYEKEPDTLRWLNKNRDTQMADPKSDESEFDEQINQLEFIQRIKEKIRLINLRYNQAVDEADVMYKREIDIIRAICPHYSVRLSVDKLVGICNTCSASLGRDKVTEGNQTQGESSDG